MPSLSISALLVSSSDISDISTMRLKEIQDELKERKVSYTDCFDKESILARLVEARNKDTNVSSSQELHDKQQDVSDVEHNSTPTSSSNFDRDTTLAQLRSKKVAQLRTELAHRNIRWANMFEKEDLVQALLASMEASAKFSISGALTPGEVGIVTGDDLDKELSGTASTPLILDIYATWCGPCKLMAPQLEQAAKELGSEVRVAKIDSDKFPQWSSKLKVGAFPTIILFDRTGKEIKRVEGALMKDQLIQLAKNQM
jgi:thioredoxin